MNSINRIAALASVILLSACQSNGMAPQIPSESPQSLSQDTTSEPQSVTQIPAANTSGTLRSERFSTSNITTKCTYAAGLHFPPISSVAFTASGTATGPYVGTFQASGTLSVPVFSQTGLLREQFSIHSGSTTISGTARGTGTIRCGNGYGGRPATRFSATGTYAALGTSGPTSLTFNATSTPKFLQTFSAPTSSATK